MKMKWLKALRNVSHLPSLVLSDTMKTGLKREFDEVFTKMIESMSRPSMELVLWKPLPELLSEKPKPSSNPKNYMGESQSTQPLRALPSHRELNSYWNLSAQTRRFTIVWRQLRAQRRRWSSRHQFLLQLDKL